MPIGIMALLLVALLSVLQCWPPQHYILILTMTCTLVRNLGHGNYFLAKHLTPGSKVQHCYTALICLRLPLEPMVCLSACMGLRRDVDILWRNRDKSFFFFFLNLQDPRQKSGEEDLLWGKQIHLHWTEDTLPLLE